MSKRGVNLKVQELKTELAEIKGLEISIGKIVDESWAELEGPTPYPTLTTFRDWDMKLLEKYKPLYLPFCDACCLCTMGKCDLTRGKRGACGLDMSAQQSRIVLLACCIGAATHTGHARHLVEHLIEKYGPESPIDVGMSAGVEVEAPVTRLVCGVRPKTLRDLEEVLDYLETQITHLLAATHTGQEGSELDFESKAFHAGMIDQVGMEIADIAQISAYGLPKADPNPPLVEIGLGTVDRSKPVILVIGHNVPSAVEIVDYLERNGLHDEVEVTGICCTAHDVTRYDPKAKIIGPISWQLRYIRSGVPDVIVVDEQCIRADVLIEAEKVKTPVIASSEKNCLGLKNRTSDSAGQIVRDLVEGRAQGALIFDPRKVGEVAVRTAIEVTPKRNKLKTIPDIDQVIREAKRCTECNVCRRACPNNLPIPDAVNTAAGGDLNKLAELYDACIGCDRCESACPNQIRIHSFIVKAAEKKIKEEKCRIRVGRGAIQDIEIRNVGAPIVLGEIPGVIALVGCANYPNGGAEVAEIADEFIRRRYIVVSSGCSAMSIAMQKNEKGKSLYELYPGAFEAGGLVNVGSCVSNSHIAGA
ncbi:CO dehydrogenase/acetyl-CoA synthase complex subunit epsilon, partial [Candidatus Bathyarchaeota archaeon]|nr:CO dehydrogenase/acetyl-CoA synthase complex subunit epsilon [Candidatus Bathyarchaeota archaeon]